MSTRYNDASHYENHHKAAELHDEAAHAHRAAAEQHGKQDHETGGEHSRRALERANQAFLAAQEVHRESANGHGIATFGHEQIAALAYQLWLDRGSPDGSADQDWHDAVVQLRQKAMHGQSNTLGGH